MPSLHKTSYYSNGLCTRSPEEGTVPHLPHSRYFVPSAGSTLSGPSFSPRTDSDSLTSALKLQLSKGSQTETLHTDTPQGFLLCFSFLKIALSRAMRLSGFVCFFFRQFWKDSLIHRLLLLSAITGQKADIRTKKAWPTSCLAMWSYIFPVHADVIKRNGAHQRGAGTAASAPASSVAFHPALVNSFKICLSHLPRSTKSN